MLFVSHFFKIIDFIVVLEVVFFENLDDFLTTVFLAFVITSLFLEASVYFDVFPLAFAIDSTMFPLKYLS